MNVSIGGKRVRLSDKNLIGTGGEAMIFKHGNRAVKVYHTPGADRDQKLRDMVGAVLPAAVIAPQELVFDEKGAQVIGFTMCLLDPEYVEARRLATKNYRATSGITSKEVAALFLHGLRTLNGIHQAGMVVGDLNDLNLMFHNAQPADLIYIDTDSFQFGAHPCMVGTEAFLDPLLYGVDLASKAVFRPANDWYSFAVLLFKSLLLTHPYGGVHPTLPTLTQRAHAGVSVLHPDVKYPRIAYHPDMLSDDLGAVFEGMFTKGSRSPIPEAVLQDYIQTLRVCPSCKSAYPSSRAHCPVCAAASPQPVAPKMGAALASCRTLIQTGGPILTWHIDGEKISLIARENGKLNLYRLDGVKGGGRTVPLFDALSDARFAFLGDTLIVSPSAASDDLMVVDCSGSKPVGVLKTATGHYSGSEPQFGASARHLYRLAGGYLMRGYLQNGLLLEQPVMAIAENQTWIRVSGDAERVFGCFRVYNTYTFWVLNDQTRVDASVTPLEPGEIVIEMDAKFASGSVLLARRTQLNGVERVRLDEVDLKGKLLHSRIVTTPDDYQPLNAHAYLTGVILRAGDTGLVQERMDGSAGKVFPQTEPFVGSGDLLAAYGNGLLVRKDDRVYWLTL
ncbi:MAG: hypothetical protein IT322_00965 [Anaerolineae bacterium]|nr:hypothetical protein [Anaerolineae bacterium]